LIFGAFLLLGESLPAIPFGDPAWPEIVLTSQDRVLILAPHPDDETIGCAGIIQQAVALQLPVRVVFLTYGDNNQWSFLLYRKRPELSPQGVLAMGMVRHAEAVAAARLLGLSEEQLTFLGYPDAGTLNIWYRHWGEQPPYRSLLTRATSVPYDNAFRPGAPYRGEEILADLKAILRDFKPTKVFLPHPADHNPDHQALYLFARVALWDLASELRPRLYPYLIHYPHWPQPQGYQPAAPLLPPPNLGGPIAWRIYRLTAEQAERKLEALKAHQSQVKANAHYLYSFVSPNELFGDYPIARAGNATADGTVLAEPPGLETRAPEELTADEEDAFVDLKWRAVQLKDDHLVITIDFSRRLGQGAGASIYAFSYRADRPFREMPKLHVRISEFGYSIYDQARPLPRSLVKVIRHPRQVIVEIPLEVLALPQKVLISARTTLGEVPLDWEAWRVVELEMP